VSAAEGRLRGFFGGGGEREGNDTCRNTLIYP
jgi:hypothetical protein